MTAVPLNIHLTQPAVLPLPAPVRRFSIAFRRHSSSVRRRWSPSSARGEILDPPLPTSHLVPRNPDAKDPMNQRLKHCTLKRLIPYSDAIRNLYRAFSSLPASSASTTPRPSSSYISEITTKILNSQSPSQALKYFNSISTNLNYEKSIRPHAAIVFTLTRAKQFKEATCLMKDLIHHLLKHCTRRRVCSLIFKELTRINSSNPDTDVLGVLIIGLSETRLVEEACWVYWKLPKLPVLRVCNALLNCTGKALRLSTFWDIYNDMVSLGVAPSVVTYGILMDTCCNQCDVGKALQLFDEMRGEGIEPSVVIYTTLIRGLCNEGRIVEAEDLFKLMRKCGISPGLYTYNTLLDGYCKLADLSRVIQLYSGMLCNSLEPDVVTFGILVDALCKEGETDCARNLFAFMAKFAVHPNIFVYNCLIDGQCKAGNLLEALFLVAEMGKLNIVPDSFTYSILVKGLCDAGRVEEASVLLLKMKSDGILVNAVAYNSLVDGYCKYGNMKKAMDLCSQMIENGIEPNSLTYSTLVHGHVIEGDMDAAMGIYMEMGIKGLPPDVVVYTDLIDGHFKNNDPNAALGLYQEMLKDGVVMNVFTVSCLVDGLCKIGRLSDAIRIFLKFTSPMDDRNLANHIAYTTVIHGMCMHQRMFEAGFFFRDMRCYGVKPDTVTYMIIMRAYLHAGRVSSVLMLHADAMKMAILPNSAVYGVLAKCYNHVGDIRSLLACFEDLNAHNCGCG